MKTAKSKIQNNAIIILILLSVFLSAFAKKKKNSSMPDNLEGTISLSGAYALYPMAVKWAEEFKKIHPNVKIDIQAGGAGKGMTDAISGLVDFGMVSRDINPEEIRKGAFPIAVAKDAVVATVNASNPNIATLLTKGMKKNDFANIYVSGTCKNWKQAGCSVSAPIRVYTRSDACGAAETWAKYFGKKQEDLQGVGVFGDPGLLQAIKKDVTGIGYNNIGYAYDSKTRKPLPRTAIVPIDINSNGKIDADENFYGTIDELMKAISEGKYPSPPARDLYLVSKNKPQKKVVVEFLKWVLSDGQRYCGETNFISLSKEKASGEINKFNTAKP